MLKLQKVDLELIRLRQELAQIPIRENEILQKLELLQHQAEEADVDVREMEKQMRHLEQDVESARASQEKLKDRQMDVKTNKEYQAILAEIDFLDKEIFRKEDLILELMEKSQAAAVDASAKKRTLEEESKRLAAEQSQLADSRKFLENELANNLARKEEIEAEIPVEFLNLYNKRAAVCGGIPMSEVRNEICQICHVRIRPQVYQELRTTDILHQCDSCQRILYVLDEN
jgi:predicted  nucleic acid-binding Zn-ribbon protein